MMQTASISSLPFAMGTNTDAAALQTSALRRMGAPPARRGCRRCRLAADCNRRWNGRQVVLLFSCR